MGNELRENEKIVEEKQIKIQNRKSYFWFFYLRSLKSATEKRNKYQKWSSIEKKTLENRKKPICNEVFNRKYLHLLVQQSLHLIFRSILNAK